VTDGNPNTLLFRYVAAEFAVLGFVVLTPTYDCVLCDLCGPLQFAEQRKP